MTLRKIVDPVAFYSKFTHLPDYSIEILADRFFTFIYRVCDFPPAPDTKARIVPLDRYRNLPHRAVQGFPPSIAVTNSRDWKRCGKRPLLGSVHTRRCIPFFRGTSAINDSEPPRTGGIIALDRSKSGILRSIFVILKTRRMTNSLAIGRVALAGGLQRPIVTIAVSAMEIRHKSFGFVNTKSSGKRTYQQRKFFRQLLRPAPAG